MWPFASTITPEPEPVDGTGWRKKSYDTVVLTMFTTDGAVFSYMEMFPSSSGCAIRPLPGTKAMRSRMKKSAHEKTALRFLSSIDIVFTDCHSFNYVNR